MDPSVPDGLSWQLSFLTTRLEVDSSRPLFRCRYSFVYFRRMVLHFLQPGESQDGHLGPVDDSGCCGPQSLPIPWSLCLSGLCSHLDTQWALKLNWVLTPRPVCLVIQGHSVQNQCSCLFWLVGQLCVFYWFPCPGYHPNRVPWAHFRALLPLPGDSIHTFLFMWPLL